MTICGSHHDAQSVSVVERHSQDFSFWHDGDFGYQYYGYWIYWGNHHGYGHQSRHWRQCDIIWCSIMFVFDFERTNIYQPW